MSRRLCAVLLVALAAPAAASLFWFGGRAKSAWRDKRIAIDGSAEDWRDREPDEAEGLAFLFANDDKDLYAMFSAHTRAGRDQLAGLEGQDVTLWLDPKGGTRRGVGLKVLPPEQGGRAVESLGVPDGAKLEVGPLEERGVLEVRVPLSAFGRPLPRVVSVGLEAGPARRPRAEPARREEQEGKGRRRAPEPDAEDLRPISVWVRVTLAEPPR